MQPLGIELFNYACFDQQFISLQPGLNLFVGKNSSGKTAILRFLASLSALPVGRLIQPPISGYVRQSGGPMRFSLMYRLSPDEAKCFLPEAVESEIDRVCNDCVFKYNFSYARQNGMYRFDDAIAAGFSLWELPKVTVLTGVDGVRLHQYRRTSQNPIRTEIVNGGTATSGGESTAYFNAGTKWSAPLEQHSKVCLIEAHRVSAENVALQAAQEFSSNAQNLPAFLDTLYGQDREKFEEVEDFVCEVFPAYKRVNPRKDNNAVYITLTDRATNAPIRLSNTGTGVEQLLALATAVVTQPASTILLDEPHSFLHPAAERRLIEFLDSHREHTIVISTHSVVMMDYVDGNKITLLEPPGHGYGECRESETFDGILNALGFSKSGILISDQLIIVEGESDAAILPQLLLKALGQYKVARTGFPHLGGVGEKPKTLLFAAKRIEALIRSLGRDGLKRLYLFDGDRDEATRGEIRGWKIAGAIPVLLTPGLELENHLLDSEAIAEVINQEIEFAGGRKTVEANEVRTEIERLLKDTDNHSIFPFGLRQGQEAIRMAKGSQVLESLFQRFACSSYSKTRHGPMLAKYTDRYRSPLFEELLQCVSGLFATSMKRL